MLVAGVYSCLSPIQLPSAMSNITYLLLLLFIPATVCSILQNACRIWVTASQISTLIAYRSYSEKGTSIIMSNYYYYYHQHHHQQEEFPLHSFASICTPSCGHWTSFTEWFSVTRRIPNAATQRSPRVQSTQSNAGIDKILMGKMVIKKRNTNYTFAAWFFSGSKLYVDMQYSIKEALLPSFAIP